MKELEYLKLFEAFESQKLAGTLKFIKDAGDRKRFIESLKSVCNAIGFPYSELNDDYFAYLPFKPALQMSSGSGPAKCDAESKWIKGEYCDKGKIKRTWGKTIRITTCPVCKGTGIRNNKSDLKLIKFWFNSDGRFLNMTGVDGVIRKFNEAGKLSENLEDYNIVNESLTMNDLQNLPTGAYVLAMNYFGGRNRNTICYYVNESKTTGNSYLIQNAHNGGAPQQLRREIWHQIANYSYAVAVRGGDNRQASMKLLELKEPPMKDVKVGENPYEWNVSLLLQPGPYPPQINPYINIKDFLKDANFAIVMNYAKLRSSKYTKLPDITRSRKERKTGSRLTLTDDIVRKQNIERYLASLAASLDISEDIVNCNKLLIRSTGYRSSLFVINSGDSLKGKLDKIIETYLSLMKSPDKDKKRIIETLSTYTNEIFRSSMKKASDANRNISEIRKRLRVEKKTKALEILDQIESLSDIIYRKLLDYNIECIEDFDIVVRKLTTIRNLMRSERYPMRNLSRFFDHVDHPDFNTTYAYLTDANTTKAYNDILDHFGPITRMISRV